MILATQTGNDRMSGGQMHLLKSLLRGFVVAVLLSTSAAWANNLRIDRVSGHYTGVGGEFTVLAIDAGDLNPYIADYDAKATYTCTSGAYAGQTGIQTFCVEYQEHISIPGNYHYDLGPNAIKGGTTTGDPISVGVGYLYSQFAQGILSGYNYIVGSGRNSAAGQLQNAIWWLEGEISLNTSQIAANTYLSQVASVFGSAVSGKADVALVGSQLVTAAFYGVGAVNMGPPATYPNQDQLYWHRVANTQVPDGGTSLVLLGLAIAGLTLARRISHRAS